MTMNMNPHIKAGKLGSACHYRSAGIFSLKVNINILGDNDRKTVDVGLNKLLDTL